MNLNCDYFWIFYFGLEIILYEFINYIKIINIVANYFYVIVFTLLITFVWRDRIISRFNTI